MLPCPYQTQRAEPKPDGWLCSSPEALTIYSHGGRPSNGTCERCTIRPQPVTPEQIVETVKVAKSHRIHLDEIARRIETNLPFCNNCTHRDTASTVELPKVKCDQSKRKCGCVNITIDNCPIERFTNGH